jgi:hypothetical protein
VHETLGKRAPREARLLYWHEAHNGPATLGDHDVITVFGGRDELRKTVAGIQNVDRFHVSPYLA